VHLKCVKVTCFGSYFMNYFMEQYPWEATSRWANQVIFSFLQILVVCTMEQYPWEATSRWANQVIFSFLQILVVCTMFRCKVSSYEGVRTDIYKDFWPLSQSNTPQRLGNDCFLFQDNFLKKEAVLQRVKEERNILQTIKGRKVYWIGHILRRNCLLEHVIEWRMEVTRRSGRRRKQLLDDLEGKRGYWKFKEEALDRPVCKTRCGRA